MKEEEEGLSKEDEITPGDPLWKQFEIDVKDFIAKADPASSVEHNVKRLGMSGRERQMDAIATGCVASVDIEVAFECKRYTTRKVGIGAVDAFVGKCIDMQIGHGVLYAFGGFDAGAEARARVSTNPRIEVRDLSHLTLVQPWEEVLPRFLGTVPCPNPNCWDRVWILDEDPASDIRDGGICDSCGSAVGACRSCDEVNLLDADEQSCTGCDAFFEVSRDRKTSEVIGIHWMAGSPDPHW
ncbi:MULTISPECIES: restriction endonuclease [unclassified Nocardioides]|uniref:restriction endonuclease n=1 Tax=unclassified Nocardioides TaxID=2615069 RepID=UPI00005715B3|nr:MULTISPECIES: restriction endonuclease [unclassified Nocardioides]ABL80600.1 hypothetical protein Noca_1083 [Nocardioides sp. JS614]